jgi:hypothetical protein
MLEAAARYIWTLSDGTGAAMEPRGTGGRGMGNGMMRNGMMSRHGAMDPDSAPPAGRGPGMNRGGGGGGR